MICNEMFVYEWVNLTRLQLCETMICIMCYVSIVL